MLKTRRLVGEGAWVLAGQLLSAIAILATLKLWAVYLQPAQVGLMGLIVGFASILVGVTLGPLTQSILVSYATYTLNGRKHEFRAVGSRIVSKISLMVVALTLAVGFPIAHFLELHGATGLLVAGLFLVDAWRAFEISLFAAARRPRDAAIIHCGDAWFRFAFLWLSFVMFQPNAYTAISGMLTGALAFLVLMRLVLRFEAHPGTKPQETDLDRSIREKLVRLAKPLFPALLLSNITEMLNRYLIAATIGLEAAGLFVISYGLVRRPYGLLNSVTDWTMRPIMASAISEKDSARVAQARRLWLAVGSGFAILGIFLFYFLKEQILRVLLSSEYAAAADLLVWLAIALTFFNIANIFGGFSLAAGNSRAVLINNAVGAAAGGVLTVVLCLYFGLQGAVWALVGGYLLQLVASIITSPRKLRRGRDGARDAT